MSIRRGTSKSQIETLKNEIGIQEELQRVVQECQKGSVKDGLSALSSKLESLVSMFVDRGDVVAEVGALSDGLRRCGDQLANQEFKILRLLVRKSRSSLTKISAPRLKLRFGISLSKSAYSLSRFFNSSMKNTLTWQLKLSY